MENLPSGTVAYLMTDVQGSSALWERDRQAMQALVADLDSLCERIANEHFGTLIKSRGEGDSHFFVFDKASNAVQAAGRLQSELRSASWNTLQIAVRAAVHAGEVDPRGQDYYGPVVNRCARIRSLAHGGQTLLSESAERLARTELPEGWSLADLGRHRLKDLMDAERLFQLEASGIAKDFPPLPRLDQAARNLPVQLAQFIGREQEIQDLQNLLTTKRLVTISGVGGAGKTRVAMQLAAEYAESRQDGIDWIDLTPVQPGQVETAVAMALQVPLGTPIHTFLASRDTALFVDNCEHVLKESADLIAAWLKSCPSLTVVATSREPLHIAGEVVFRLPSLSVPKDPANATVRDLAECESTTLFVERARERDIAFVPDADSSPVIAQICALLDGIPLAVEQAACRIVALSPAQILQSLSKRFAILRLDQRDALPRHVTMRAAIDWSFGMLSEPESALFAGLSVFVGGFTLESAHAVLAGPDSEPESTADLLASLVDKSLVVAQQSSNVKRFRLLEVFREYAAEHLPEASAAPSRHFDWFLALAHESDSDLAGPNQAETLARLDAESGNIEAAWRFGETSRDERLAEMAIDLRRYWFRRGRLEAGRARFRVALDLLAEPEPTLLRARLLNALGVFSWQQGDFKEAEHNLNLARDAWATLNEPKELAATYLNLAIVLSDAGQTAEALATFKLAKDVFERLDDPRGAAIALYNIGVLQSDAEDPQAIDTLESACDQFQKLGLEDRLAAGRFTLASTLVPFGRIQEAVRLISQSFDTWSQTQDTGMLGGAMVELALICLKRGAAPEAAILAFAAQTTWESQHAVHRTSQRHLEQCLAALELELDAKALRDARKRAARLSIRESLRFAQDCCTKLANDDGS